MINNKKPVVIIRPGRQSGKAITHAFVEALNEMSVDPPATAEEAEAFCRVHIKRCNMNLANAKDRGDKRAVLNLERKLAVYEYLYKLVKEKAGDMALTMDCPKCLTHSINKDGVCACCGYEEKPSSGNAIYWATEQAYKNGYADGYADGKMEAQR